MQIKQWEDKNLAQYSYGILSDCEKKLVLIDPSRNPRPYLDYAAEQDAQIVGIIETHPHADFVSSHLEISQLTGAPIYTGSLVGVSYAHTDFDEGDHIEFGKIKLMALHTPGHSPDSISILLEHDGKQKAVFSGDTLFIGDCGRPDLREGAGNLRGTRIELAKKMYDTLQNKFLPLLDDVILYPAHGAGTLCGKNLSEAHSSTMGEEKQSNWSLQPMTEDEFVKSLLSDQPFVPAYFPYNVEINRKGAAPFRKSVEAVPIGEPIKNDTDWETLQTDMMNSGTVNPEKPAAGSNNAAVTSATNILIVDARPAGKYRKTHLPNSLNLMEGEKFETWLGSIIKPEEKFYLAGESIDQLKRLIERAAAIGYEPQIEKAFVLEYATESSPAFDFDTFKDNAEDYTIIDVRNNPEVKNSKPFPNSISIPLPELRGRVNEIPTDKPIVVHCAGGYRSAAGSSLIKSALNGKARVFDLSEKIKEFM